MPRRRWRGSKLRKLWSESIKAQLIARSQKLQSRLQQSDTDKSNGDQDWITNELDKRIEAAARLLPLPEELESSAVAAQPEIQRLVEELNQAGKAIAISNKRKVKPEQRNYSS